MLFIGHYRIEYAYLNCLQHAHAVESEWALMHQRYMQSLIGSFLYTMCNSDLNVAVET